MSDTDVATALPLHERTIVKTILYFTAEMPTGENCLALRALHRIRRSGVCASTGLAVPPLPPAARFCQSNSL